MLCLEHILHDIMRNSDFLFVLFCLYQQHRSICLQRREQAHVRD